MREDDLPEPGGRRGDFVSPGAWKEFSPEFHDMQKNCPTRTSGLLKASGGIDQCKGRLCAVCVRACMRATCACAVVPSQRERVRVSARLDRHLREIKSHPL